LTRQNRFSGIAGRVTAALEEPVPSRKVPALLVVAPPHTLADLRRRLHPDVKQRVAAEINKDLTNHQAAEIETRLLRSGRRISRRAIAPSPLADR
jgi:protein required for attachment to host cells